jgi:hypothetical protein
MMKTRVQTRVHMPAVRGDFVSGGVERISAGSSLMEIFDHVLDKGVVIDAWTRVSTAGIDLITVEARVVVTSIETHLRYSSLIAH